MPKTRCHIASVFLLTCALSVEVDAANVAVAVIRLAEAESLMRRALEIDEASFGPNQPSVARDLDNLALLLHATSRSAEAELLMRRAVKIVEASMPPGHPWIG